MVKLIRTETLPSMCFFYYQFCLHLLLCSVLTNKGTSSASSDVEWTVFVEEALLTNGGTKCVWYVNTQYVLPRVCLFSTLPLSFITLVQQNLCMVSFLGDFGSRYKVGSADLWLNENQYVGLCHSTRPRILFSCSGKKRRKKDGKFTALCALKTLCEKPFFYFPPPEHRRRLNDSCKKAPRSFCWQ